MGVWIEIEILLLQITIRIVTPCVGVWIEIHIDDTKLKLNSVTPCVGVWIEISNMIKSPVVVESLPAWECGLK